MSACVIISLKGMFLNDQSWSSVWEFLSDENFELSGDGAIDDEVGWGRYHNLEENQYFEIRFM